MAAHGVRLGDIDDDAEAAFGVEPLDWFRTGVELARHEASFGWVVTQGAAELGWIGAGGDDGWARELLGDPLATSASSRCCGREPALM